jgi:hypothetical protein
MLDLRCLKLVLLSGLLGLAQAAMATEPLVVTLRERESNRDQRSNYFSEAIRLALDKTVPNYGPYRLQRTPPMNKERALLSAQQRLYPHMVVTAAPGEVKGLKLVPVPIAADLGVTGYRVCFVAADRRLAVEQAQTLDQLRQFRFLQGKGWADAEILRANGFQVEEVSGYDSLFAMVTKGRVDLLCRSLLEVHDEWRAQAQAGMPGLALDASFLLVYDLPLLFYLHPADKQLLQRLTNGLRRAWMDGSLQALLMKHLQPALAVAALERRRVFHLSSEQSAGIGFDDQPYRLDLLRLSSGRRQRRITAVRRPDWPTHS